MQLIKSIQNRIYEVRDQRVMLDKDLAVLYETAPEVLHLAVQRNIKRFTLDCMFQLTAQEYENLRLQIETSNANTTTDVRKIAAKGRTSHLPFVFTAQGVAMLSVVLNSEKAINMHISIIRGVVEIRRALLLQPGWKKLLRHIKGQNRKYDILLNPIYDAIENLLHENTRRG